LPGIGSTQKAFDLCALLPKIEKIQEKTKTIPKNTHESISAGIIEGFSEMINGLIKKKISQLKLNKHSKILITGGESKLLQKKLEFPFIFEEKLVLKGLACLYESKINKSHL
ncbi:MAG: type III pantothenate kinase, partial [Candidatus Omnitrophica bacterium]|nr:type III pantothenate kinase [Candidatus Omnitrophota bacterium]